MKRHRRLFRVWLTSALGVGSLAFASSASAMFRADAGDGTTASHVPVGSSPGGFDWGIFAIAVVAIVLVAVAAFAVTQVSRNRGHLAPTA
jgi:hypothetical protein